MKIISNGYYHFIKKAVLVILCLSFFPASSYSDQNKFYYLQISSYRNMERAAAHLAMMGNRGYKGTCYGEEVDGMGLWYRVYLGPYSSRKQADKVQADLSDMGLIKESFVRRKNIRLDRAPDNKNKHLIAGDIKADPDSGNLLRVGNMVFQEVALKTDQLNRFSDSDNKLNEESPVRLAALDKKDKRANGDYLGGMAAVIDSENKESRGRGRNPGEGILSLELDNTSMEIKTSLSSRSLAMSNGTVATSAPVPVTPDIRYSLPTTAHTSQLVLHYGYTDYIELYAGAGVTFKDRSVMKPSFSAGIRVNFLEFETGKNVFFYSSVAEEYFHSKYRYDYNLNSDLWEKNTEIDMLSSRIEFGFKSVKYDFYVGGTYSDYQEDTTRRLLNNLPPTLAYAYYIDKLDEKNNVSGFIGFTYWYSPTVNLSMEGEYGMRKMGRISFGYLF